LPYGGYNAQLDATVSTLFAGAAQHFVLSALDSQFARLDATGASVLAGGVLLRDARYAPAYLVDDDDNAGIASLIRGLADSVAQSVDGKHVDDVREFALGSAARHDAFAAAIQRGRDFGLPSFAASTLF
jgi:hypothetical protein